MSEAVEKENSKIEIELDKEGKIKINSNMSQMGSIHLMLTASQIIIEQTYDKAKVDVSETDTVEDIKQ